MSSLLILNKEKDIVTVSDELLDMLGYKEKELIGRSVNKLAPIKKNTDYLLLHATLGYIHFELCIHNDPLGNGFDYLLLRSKQAPKIRFGPASLLRLNLFGVIENVHPSLDFPQTINQLLYKPIMSFVHESDVQVLCQSLSQNHCTLRIRWSYSLDSYQWVLLTVMNTTHRSSLNKSPEPVCIIRKVYEPHEIVPVYWNTGQILHTMYTMWDQIRKNGISQFVESIRLAMDQGKTYMVEFYSHVINYLSELLDELEYLSENDLNSSDLKTIKKRKRCFKRSNVQSIKVYDDSSNLWTIPLEKYF